MATVTIYNDDKHGRAIRIVTVNPFASTISEAAILEADKSDSYEVRNGTMLIVTTAEKDSADADGDSEHG
jgi:hypothetical protein